MSRPIRILSYDGYQEQLNKILAKNEIKFMTRDEFDLEFKESPESLFNDE